MILKLEIEAEDALELCRIHSALKDVSRANIRRNPARYSAISRLTNAFFAEVIKRLPPDEFYRIKRKTQKYN